MTVGPPTAPAASRHVVVTDTTFTVGTERLAATVVAPAGVAPTVVHFHGLGETASRHGVRYLLDVVAARGVGTVTFDYSGNGDSTGRLAEATLRRRLAESLGACGLLDPARAPVLMGTSMGAHLAATITPEVRPRALVLVVPAAYPAGAVDDRFGDGLARPGRHPDSPAFSGLREFTGDLLVIAAERDEVVPAETVDGYLAAAPHARTARVIRLDTDHFVHRWLPGAPQARAEVEQAIAQIVGGPGAPHR